MGRLLGIDFGVVRIGIAVSDERRFIALPVGMIKAGKNMEETAQLLIKHVAQYGKFDKIILGLPLLLNGKEGEMALLVKQFGQFLEKAFEVPVTYWDERLTSAQVERMLKEAGMNRKRRTEHVDALAATTILQNYLDSQI